MPRRYRLGPKRPELKLTAATKGRGVVIAIEHNRVWIDLLRPRSGRIWFPPCLLERSPVSVGAVVSYAQVGDLVKKVEPVNAEGA